MPKSTQDIYRELLKNGADMNRRADMGQTVTANQIRDTGGAMGSALRGEGGTGGTDWNAMMEGYWNQIQNRPKFSYDANNDALFQAYKDQYVHQGRRAMEDTMGQAAGLTGGYGSTYGQAVGNQAYNEYLTKLNEQIPALYGQARAAYDADTQDLYNMYNIALGNANQQYDREQHDKEYADQQAYQQWQMQQTEQGNAREIALMMLQMGKTPSAELLQQAGISAADAAALAQFYASQLAGTGGSGGSGGGGSGSGRGRGRGNGNGEMDLLPGVFSGVAGALGVQGKAKDATAAAAEKQLANYNDFAAEIKRFAGNMPPTKGNELTNRIFAALDNHSITREQANKLLAQMGYK